MSGSGGARPAAPGSAVLACEIVFILVFTQWYLSRYLHWGGQLPFAVMIALILGLWVVILSIGWWRSKSRA